MYAGGRAYHPRPRESPSGTSLLGCGLTLTLKPEDLSCAVASAWVRPITLGTSPSSFGMKSVTVPLSSTEAPAFGSVAMTVFCGLVEFLVLMTARSLASVRIASASSLDLPMRPSGTFTFSVPLDTMSLTPDSFSTLVPSAGSVAMTAPFSTSELNFCSSVTVSPSFSSSPLA